MWNVPKKGEMQSPLDYRHSPLVVTADNRNGSSLRVWDLFNGLLLISKTKENKTQKHKKKRYELTPRYQRVRPKYGQSALHLSSGRENRQAPSGTHETFHPARIAFHGRTAWGSNPHKGLRLPFFFFYYPINGTFDLCDAPCRLRVQFPLQKHDPWAEKETREL